MIKSEEITTLLSESETLNSQLKKSLHKLQYENRTLNITVAVITGALFASVWQRQSLAISKRMLSNLVNNLLVFKNQHVRIM